MIFYKQKIVILLGIWLDNESEMQPAFTKDWKKQQKCFWPSSVIMSCCYLYWETKTYPLSSLQKYSWVMSVKSFIAYVIICWQIPTINKVCFVLYCMSIFYWLAATGKWFKTCSLYNFKVHVYYLKISWHGLWSTKLLFINNWLFYV